MKEQLSFSIIDEIMAIDAMRDSGYRSTTHALAELVDNSIESGATCIEIFGISQKDSSNRIRMKELAVLDNGEGMNSDTLRGSLRYGHGTRRKRQGIGRFGLGLPNSSMSQARAVDIWSWQNGVTNALHTRLSLDDVKNGLKEIPNPKLEKIPDIFFDASQRGTSDSGTLVVWSDLDRVEWKQASTTFAHAEHFLGRIYRRFLAKPSERLHNNDSRDNKIGPQRTITCIPINEIDGKTEILEDSIFDVKPNDPLYLISETSCPEDFGEGPMFIELEGSPFEIDIRGHKVYIRATYARPHVRDPNDINAFWPTNLKRLQPGSTPWGKHANQNMGISIVRSHREINLDKSWVSGDDPRERWWTIEVDFPTELDDVFGVTNNKQGAMTFQRLSSFDWEREALPGEENRGDFNRRIKNENPDRHSLLQLKYQIERARKSLREKVKVPSKKKRHESNKTDNSEASTTAKIKERIKEGNIGESDKSGKEGTEKEQVQKQLESLIVNHHFDKEEAQEIISITKKSGYIVRFIQSAQSIPAFFSVDPLPNVLQVALNKDHPVYSHLYDVMQKQDIQNLSKEEVSHLLDRARTAFEILLFSWARYEEEQPEKMRRKVIDSRIEWGKYARDFLDDNSDDFITPTDLI